MQQCKSISQIYQDKEIRHRSTYCINLYKVQKQINLNYDFRSQISC